MIDVKSDYAGIVEEVGEFDELDPQTWFVRIKCDPRSVGNLRIGLHHTPLKTGDHVAAGQVVGTWDENHPINNHPAIKPHPDVDSQDKKIKKAAQERHAALIEEYINYRISKGRG